MARMTNSNCKTRFFAGGRRLSALGLTAVLIVSCVPAAAAEEIGNGVTPTYDEAYYATTDYYGNLTEGSVVKSYALNGADAITDYGVYDQVDNLTDGTEPVSTDGETRFVFNADTAPDRFYFEGKTAQPFDDLPWTVSLSYTLNGVPTAAEDLAGKMGEVEIHLDIVPNDNASDYAKNNYTLEAMAMFNQDDILSLQAEGAQVQLIGNLRVVLFLALPGEEEHFVIRVGSNNFTFDGMTLLMVPATLAQLDEIASLRERKNELEQDYNKLSGSLDTLLDSLNGMSGSLNETAQGLDELNQARGTLSAGKGQVYADADAALADLAAVAKAMEPAADHAASAQENLTSLKKNLTSLNSALQNINDNLDDAYTLLDELSGDCTNAQQVAAKLATALNNIDNELPAAETALKNGAALVTADLPNQEIAVTDSVTLTVKQIQTILAAMTTLYTNYVQSAGTSEGFETFASQQLASSGLDSDTIALYLGLWEQRDALSAQLTAAQSIPAGLTAASSILDEIGALHTTQTDKLITSLLAHAQDGISLGRDLLSETQAVLTQINTLQKSLSDYEPELQATLNDTETLLTSLTDGLKDLHTFLSGAEALLKTSGTQLDSGAQKTLTGLADTLRKTANSLSTTGNVKSAKNSIDSIIQDTWDEYTGETNNLLNMDSTAEAVSLTSAQNPAPQSIQVLIRTQEIKTADVEESTEEESSSQSTTFWQRVETMFRDFGRAFARLFD